MNQRKKKAFTLTELLVVVVIIGVLAAVILPKFNKVMETRKTTEAEELMAAVRTEQEYRCAIDKPYIGDMEKLSEIIPNAQTKNFNYSLETTGMLASSKGKYNYELKMPSYADGRVCCEGAGCTQLNKDYPTCAELQTKPDYKVSTECTATLPPPSEPEQEPPPNACSDPQETTEPCSTGCGVKTREVIGCEDGSWQYGNWNESACREPETETYDCAKENPGTGGTKTRTEICNQETGEWYYPEEWEGECLSCGEKPSPDPEVVSCTPSGWSYACGQKTRSVECNTSTHQWQAPDWSTIPCITTSSCMAEDEIVNCWVDDTGRASVKLGSRPTGPNVSFACGTGEFPANQVTRVSPCTDGQICLCSSIGTYGWHGQIDAERSSHQSGPPATATGGRMDIDRDFRKVFCMVCTANVARKNCTVIRADETD